MHTIQSAAVEKVLIEKFLINEFPAAKRIRHLATIGDDLGNVVTNDHGGRIIGVYETIWHS
jgi:hypothetical protein